jgi:thiol-disulfide isomerase/thioredoxin
MSRAIRTTFVTVLTGLFGFIAGLAGIYGMRTVAGNDQPRELPCTAALETAEALKPLLVGQMANLIVSTEPRRVGDIRFTDRAGQPIQLDRWKGRMVLVNAWAEWCPPCRTELPSLDKLQQELGHDDFEVVAVNVDKDPKPAQKPLQFWSKAGLSDLDYYADPSMRVWGRMPTDWRKGLPGTMLIDGAGCIVATLYGPAEWTGADAKAVLTAALGQHRSRQANAQPTPAARHDDNTASSMALIRPLSQPTAR